MMNRQKYIHISRFCAYHAVAAFTLVSMSACNKTNSNTDNLNTSSAEKKEVSKEETNKAKSSVSLTAAGSTRFSTQSYKNPKAYIKSVACFYLFVFEDYQGVLKEVREIEKEQRRDNQFLSLIEGSALFKLGKYKESIEPLSVFIKLVPNDYTGYWHRAKSYYHIGQYQKSIEDYQKVVVIMGKKLEDSVTLTDEKNKLFLGSIYKRIGACYEKSGNYKEAVLQYEKALKIESRMRVSSVTNSIPAKGKRLNQLSAYRTKYDSAIKSKPNDWQLYFKRACINRDIGKYQNALKDFKKASSLSKQDVSHLVNYEISKLYFMQHQPKKAASVFRKIFRFDPLTEDTNTYRLLGIVQPSELLNYSQYLKRTNKLIKLSPEQAENYYNRAMIYLGYGGYKYAIKDLEKFISLSPPDPKSSSRVQAAAYCSLCYKSLGNESSAKSSLLTASKEVSKEIWISNILSYLLGNKTKEELISSCNNNELKEVKSYLFIGQNNLASRHLDLAKKYFYKVIESSDISTDEYSIAQAGIIRIDFSQRMSSKFKKYIRKNRTKKTD